MSFQTRSSPLAGISRLPDFGWMSTRFLPELQATAIMVIAKKVKIDFFSIIYLSLVANFLFTFFQVVSN
jgi:hypothetical protein